MKETPLIILGAGKSTIEFIDLVNDINQKTYNKIKIIGILDDDKKLKNKKMWRILFILMSAKIPAKIGFRREIIETNSYIPIEIAHIIYEYTRDLFI